MTEMATATNPTEANASTEATATLLATASTETATTQQTQTVETPAATPRETPVAEAPRPGETQVPVVLEKYEFKAPEGTEYDPAVVESYSAAAKKAGLTQDAAQKLIEEMAPALAARHVDQVKAIQDEWRSASAADKEFGGDKLQENLAIAKKSIQTFGSPELGTLLEETGLGNHPEILRFLYRAGKAISEDKFVAGAAHVSAPDLTQVLYDHPKKG